MAATTTAFEAELIAEGFPLGIRGDLGGPAYGLRQAYLRGITDPTAHALAKADGRSVDALRLTGKLASFDAITAV
jgi:hypothetical protein